jgi:hypothetical protein
MSRAMSLRFPLAAAAVALLAAGCTPPPTAALFPLDKGHRWTYDVTTAYDDQTVEHDTQVFTTEGSESIEGGSAWRRRSDAGVDYWLRSDATGTYRVASKSDIDAEPKLDQPARYVLKMPLAVGTTWQASTTAYLLRRRNEFPPEIRHTHPAVPMTYAIDALGQSLPTRAGNFKDCVRIKGTSLLKLFADPVVGWKDLPLTTLEWYCPGVGLARLERHEPAHSSFLTGGDLTMELVSWE